MCAHGAARAAGLDRFIGFGDSTMDSGYFRYGPTGGSPGLPAGAPSDTIDRLIRIDRRGRRQRRIPGPWRGGHRPTRREVRPERFAEHVSGRAGTNYANGSAQTVPTTADDGYTHGLYNNVPIVTQIYNYLGALHNHADPNALYMISYGGNDLIWLQNQAPPGFLPQPYIQSLAAALTGSITALQAAGARTIVVLDVYAYAKLVGPGGTLTEANAMVVNEAATYSAEVWSGLGAAGVNFIPADVEGVLRYVSQNPTLFGFTAATVLASSPACGTTVGLMCAPAQLVSPDAQQTYLWGDPNHLSTAGQTIEADYIYSLLAAPSQISLLAESAVQMGLARTAHHPAADRSVRTTSWTERCQRLGQRRGRQSQLQDCAGLPQRFRHPLRRHGMGADYQTPGGVIVGMAVTAGGQTQGFSTGGHFNQTGRNAQPLCGL